MVAPNVGQVLETLNLPEAGPILSLEKAVLGCVSEYFLRKWAASETGGKVWLVSSLTESQIFPSASRTHISLLSLVLRSQKPPSDKDGRDFLSTLVCEYAHPFYIPRSAPWVQINSKYPRQSQMTHLFRRRGELRRTIPRILRIHNLSLVVTKHLLGRDCDCEGLSTPDSSQSLTL